MGLQKYKEDGDNILKRINYPLLQDHQSCELAKKYWKNDGKYGPSVLLMKLGLKAKNNDDAWEWMRQQKEIEIKTSFGGADTRFDSWPKVKNDGVWIRLAIGYNDANETIDALKKNVIQQIISQNFSCLCLYFTAL